MTHKEIFKKIGTAAPGRINFETINNILTITIEDKDISEGNMQTNNSAFESWMLVMYASKEITFDKVILKWSPNLISNKSGHYNRFMYRVLKCKEYFDWFDVDKDNIQQVTQFRDQLQATKLVLNYPESAATKCATNVNSEAEIERKFEQSGKLFEGVVFDNIGQQLPVGVFKEVKNKGASFFTRGHSAIDLWGITDRELWIFELKFQNKMIGIITETLFYMWLCEDVFIKNNIKYDCDSNTTKIRAFDKIYKLYTERATDITGVFLYDNENIHPMIEKYPVVESLNTFLVPHNLRIKTQSYNLDINLI